MRPAYIFALLAGPILAAIVRPASAAPPPAPPKDAVLVVGALHDLHPREPAFGYDDLGAAIRAFAPDVLVLEVRADELAGRTATPGRPEYPAVIWPLLAAMEVETVAMEPDGALFGAISGEAGAAFDAMRRRDPGGAAALSRLAADVDAFLLAYWQGAAQVQDATTAALADGVQSARFALAGPAFAQAQARWDDFMTGRALAAVRAHPGKRVMVIGSYKNRALLDAALRKAAPRRVIDAGQWFRRQGPAAGLPLGAPRRSPAASGQAR
ncbi:hypothetical protein [Sphingopyxis sp. JAI128]|uniref:hypothetical protein n=1 Tax=Sphingopyxis sp. JAI128 TaxID=2723066 RepID=UPI001608F99A|nr:hypothetical protein [Sphingopyxis sp. JAI128]MBB6427509.1 hypothetical protein [Sphingopyxis sp. JAI128]